MQNKQKVQKDTSFPVTRFRSAVSEPGPLSFLSRTLEALVYVVSEYPNHPRTAS